MFQEVLDLVLVQQQCAAKAMIPFEGPEFQKLVQDELDRTLNQLGDEGVPKEDAQQPGDAGSAESRRGSRILSSRWVCSGRRGLRQLVGQGAGEGSDGG